MSLAPLTTRDVSAAQAKGDDLGAGTSAIAPQPVALADTTTRSRGPPNGYPRSTKELRKCLTFHVEKQIPQAEQFVDQHHRATARVPTKTHMHRMYYDSAIACCFQNVRPRAVVAAIYMRRAGIVKFCLRMLASLAFGSFSKLYTSPYRGFVGRGAIPRFSLKGSPLL